MNVDLKEKSIDAASQLLKNSEQLDKLSASDNNEGQILKAGFKKTVEAVGYAGKRKLQKKAYSLQASDIATATLNSENGDKLYTASKRRAKSEALRESRESNLLSSTVDTNAKKLHDNRKKMQTKLRKNYEIKSEFKGGIKSDLRIEQTVEPKLTDASKHKPSDIAGNFGKRVLHFADNAADTGEANSTQSAWLDTADRATEGVSKIFSVSQTAKFWRVSKNEADIVKLSRQEEKIIKNSYRLQYKTALKTAKDSELWKYSNLYEKNLQKKAIKRKYMKNDIAEYKKAKKAGSSGKVTYTTGFNVVDKAKASVKTIGSHIYNFTKTPAGKIAVTCTLVVGLIMSLISAAGPMLLLSFGGDEDYVSSQMQMGAGFPAAVEQWRTFVTKRMTEYGYPDYVNAILATIQQESGGVSESCDGDLMQDIASGYWDTGTPSEWSSFTTEEKSIDAGCRYFITGMEKWGIEAPDDYDGLQIVAQGYNYGWGFLDYMTAQGADTWSLELSTAFSNQKASALGWKSYGHKPYGEEWLAKYQAGGVMGGGAVVEEKGAGGVVKTAQGQIGITENPANSNTVIFNTDYYGSVVSGDDYAWCCVFVWWCFNKSGNAEAFYGGGKVAGCSAVHTWAQNNGRIITGSEAQYGDLVLFGADEHIEIVVANNGDGTYTTIGGNTTSGNGGSQSNGGGVFMRTRYTSGSFPITLFIRPQYSND